MIYSSEPTLTPEQLDLINDTVRREFTVFQPQRTRFYVPSHLSKPLEDGDKRLIAAPLGVMLAQPEPDALGRVGLVRATTLTFYPRYADLYTRLQAEYPELQAVAGPESGEDMHSRPGSFSISSWTARGQVSRRCLRP